MVAPNLKTEFVFPDSGSYNLFLFNETGDSGVARTALQIRPDRKDSLRLTLDALGSVSGSSAIGNSRSAIYIPGSGFGKWFLPNGTFLLEGLPQGDFTLKVEEVIKSYLIDTQIHDSALAITIYPNDTTTVHFK
jgi:hypothetical protein